MRRAIGVAFMALLWAGGMFLVVVWLLNYLDGTRQSNLLLLIGGVLAAVATVSLAEDALELAGRSWFKKKPSWEEQYAQNIYEAFVVSSDPGDITALKLRIPFVLHGAYQNKIVLQRELFSFAALGIIANPESGLLQPVLLAYGKLVVGKMAERGLQMSEKQLANVAFDDVEAMEAQPFNWARQWLSEFGEEPTDKYILFADHWVRLFKSHKGAIEDTQPR
jgi:hypothetical protein